MSTKIQWFSLGLMLLHHYGSSRKVSSDDLLHEGEEEERGEPDGLATMTLSQTKEEIIISGL